MSYTIIFETYMVELQDGRFLQLCRSGCNNDDAGRKRDEFEGKIFKREELDSLIQKYENYPTDEGSFDLRIGSTYSSFAAYGRYLRRKWKEAKNWDKFTENRVCHATVFDGVYFLPSGEKEEVYYPATEWIKVSTDWLYGKMRGSVRKSIHLLDDLDTIIRELEEGKAMSFYIGKECKC